MAILKYRNPNRGEGQPEWINVFAYSNRELVIKDVNTALLDKVDKEYVDNITENLVEDAPYDNKQYIRQNKEWVELKSSDEKINISLITNQSSHDDLLGTIITLISNDTVTEYVWEGKEITTAIPPYVDYTISFSSVEDYKTPATISCASVPDNIRNMVVEYQTTMVTVVMEDNLLSLKDMTDATAFVSVDGIKLVTVKNGEVMRVPTGANCTITWNKVTDHTTPSAESFVAEGTNIIKTGIYLTEHVTVNVFSNNGESVDGQNVNVEKICINPIPDYASIDVYGVAIMDIYGRFYPNAVAWQAAGSPTANGIAVSDGTHRFCIAKDIVNHVCSTSEYPDAEYWGAYNKGIDGVSGATYADTAETFFDGVNNTDAIVANITSSDSKFTKSPWSAAGLCRQFTFPNGSKGYLGACGEWKLVQDSINEINTLMTAISGANIDTSNSSSSYYWTSTTQDTKNYVWYWDFGSTKSSYTGKTSTYRVRAFSEIKEANVVGPVETDSYQVVDGKVEFKVAYDSTYEVSVDAKEDYSAPSAQTFVASMAQRTINIQYTYDPYIDLSMRDIHGNIVAQSTANCYVIKKAGRYMFPIAYGAAIKNGAMNAASFTKINSGSNVSDFVNYKGVAITSPYVETDTSSVATSVQMSISDTENVVTNLNIIDGDGCKYISFSVPSVPKTGANAVISVKDADGVIMWSWHIWIWEDDLTPVEIINATPVAYNIMPVNLGSKWDEESKTHIKNWFYQWGRPNPMLCPSAYNSTSNHASYGALSYVTAGSVASNIQSGIKNPTTFYNKGTDENWFRGEIFYNIWDASKYTIGNSDVNSVKTVYDPCPVGFKVPNGNTFTYFSTSNVVGSFENGWKFKRYPSDTTGIFFPASGWKDETNGNIGFAGTRSILWLNSSYNNIKAHGLYFHASNVTRDSLSRAIGASIRPVADTDIQGQNKRTKIRIDQTITDPEAMITRIVDLGGIEAIRANSHRYTGTFANGKMTLKLLDDNDGTKYADGTSAAADIQAIGTDVWMKLPQFYWKCTEHATDVWDFEVVYGAKPDNTYKTWDDNDLIGVYEALIIDSKLYSTSGRFSVGNKSQADFKTLARNRGEGFSLVKWKHHCMMAMLYYTMYGHTNCQAKVGSGTNSFSKKAGVTDSLGMIDTVAGGNGDSNSINFWGLENWWGNKTEWIDNVVIDERIWKITEDDGTIRTITSGSANDGYIKKMIIGNNLDLIPTVTTASSTTGFCDYYGQSADNSLVCTRSFAKNEAYCGVSGVVADKTTTFTHETIGSRVAYHGDYTII